jgi:hypothetical protein
MKKLTMLLAALLLITLLSGCAGLLLLLSTAVAVGQLYGQVTDFLGLHNTDYTLYLDGYDMGIHPSPSGTLDLKGLPVGDHVLTLASDNKHLGFTVNVTIIADQQVNLGQVTPLQGGSISGTVRRLVGTSQVPLAGVRVAAVLGGSSLVTAGNSPLTLPAGNDKTVILGFTDANGNYTLGPAQFGQWIVTAAYPASYTDAQIVNVSSGNDAGGTNLLLTADPNASNAATVRGTVIAKDGGVLSQSLVASTLVTPFAPALEPTRLAALQSQIGGDLMAQPWFQWRTLATVSTVAGAYEFEVPSGEQGIYAFKFGYLAQNVDVTLAADEAKTLDYTLPPR